MAERGWLTALMVLALASCGESILTPPDTRPHNGVDTRVAPVDHNVSARDRRLGETSCGAEGQPCCGKSCGASLLCRDNRCEPCGGSGQLCCTADPRCSAPQTFCQNSTCQPCGGKDQRCCAGNVCTTPLTCNESDHTCG